MNGRKFAYVLVVVAVLLFTGCRTAPLVNVKNSGINPGSGNEVTLQQVTQAILNSATASRPAWSMNVVKPGHIVATLRNRSHSAVVDIMYTTKSYDITYNGSTNLKYDPEGPTIHANYNSWVINLDTAIKARLNAL